MTLTEYIVMILKMVSLFFVLGAAYVVSSKEDNDDDDDDGGMYQLAYVTNERWDPRLYRRSKCHTNT